MVYRLQIRNIEYFPKTGGALICPNHLSNLDPMVVGCICPRRTSFLAKRALFRGRWSSWLLYNLECIPIDRNTMGLGGMKETLDRLKAREPVMLFPEGERSRDGEPLPMMTGFTALVKRVEVPLVPVGIHGTFEAWPRNEKYPRTGSVKVVFGQPIEFSEISSLTDREMADHLADRLKACFEEARHWNRGKARSVAPSDGHGQHDERLSLTGNGVPHGRLIQSKTGPAVRNGRPSTNGVAAEISRTAGDSTLQN